MSFQLQHKLSVLPVDVKPLTVTSQPQLFVGDMLQQLHNSQLAAGVAKLTAPTVSSTLASSVTSQFVQGNIITDIALIKTSEMFETT